MEGVTLLNAEKESIRIQMEKENAELRDRLEKENALLREQLDASRSGLQVGFIYEYLKT